MIRGLLLSVTLVIVMLLVYWGFIELGEAGYLAEIAFILFMVAAAGIPIAYKLGRRDAEVAKKWLDTGYQTGIKQATSTTTHAFKAGQTIGRQVQPAQAAFVQAPAQSVQAQPIDTELVIRHVTSGDDVSLV